MPRDGSGSYTKPFPDVVDGTTIESAVYNGYTNDVSNDLNTPRPVVAGGTGANNAATARFNLAAEAAAQVVTNYDSHVWVPGSFRSAAGATGAPGANAFAGVCYIGEALADPPTNQNVVVEARDVGNALKPGPVFTRQKTAGTWSAWSGASGSDDATNRAAIYAAPFDALAYNGMQINGSMDVSQELGLGGYTGANGRICDGWALAKVGTMVVPTLAGADLRFPGFNNLLYVSVTTAQTSLGSGDAVSVYQPIEGYRIARLGWGRANPQSITIGFWVSHHRTGLYSIAVQNFNATRSYVSTYTQNVADASEYKTVTIPGCPDGTWQAGNLVGMYVVFTVASGVAPASSTNTWLAAGSQSAAGQVNGVGATSDAFRITGFVVLPGIEAPTAERSPLIMRPYDQEVVTCKRYYFKDVYPASHMIATLQAYSANHCNGSLVRFPVEMRAAPTLGSSAGANFTLQTASGGGGTLAATVPSTTLFSMSGDFTSTASSFVSGHAVQLYANATGAYFSFDARL